MSPSRVSRRRLSACAIGRGIAASANTRCRARAVTLGLPSLDPAAAAARGARSMVIGVANAGGHIPPAWFGALLEALEAGLDIISGMHVRLSSLPGLQSAADKYGRRLIDVRDAAGRDSDRVRPEAFGTPAADGRHRLRTRQEIHRARDRARSQARRIDATFRATGQTGIMIAGEGMPTRLGRRRLHRRCRRSALARAPPDHIDVIEGQGSLFHPSYAGVALGLLHGSQPDRFVVCHEPGRTHVLGHAAFALPSIEQVIEQTIALGRLTNPDIRCVGISLNTAKLDAAEAQREFDSVEKRLSLPVADPMRGGPAFERLLDACE